jgi:hypothetical protein
MSRLVSGTFFLHLYSMKERVFSFFRLHTDALLAAAAGCIFIYFFTRHSGIGISPDSVMYWSTAGHIRNSFSFTDFNDLPLTDFPLGYPSLLALLSFLSGLSILSLAPVLNACLLSVLLILSSYIMQADGRFPQPFKALVLALLACSPALLEVYAMLWSETVFLVETLALLVALHVYGRTHRFKTLLLCGIITALALVTRYAAISLLALSLGMLVLDPASGVRKKIQHIIAYLCISISLVTANLLRNHFASGHSTGVREKAIRSLYDNIAEMGAVFGGWLPFGISGSVLFWIVLIVLLTAFLFFIRHWMQASFFWKMSNLVTAWLLVYTGFILAVSTISRFEDLSSRLLSPIYIPLLLFIAGLLIEGRQGIRSYYRKTWLVFILLLYIAFHQHHYRLNAEAWEGIKDAGMPGYTEDSWQLSPMVQWLQQHKDSLPEPLYANAPDAVYFFTRKKALPLPHKDIAAERDSLLKKKNLTLIWFTDGDNPDLVGLPFIGTHYDTSRHQSLENGSVFYLSPVTR